MAEHKGFNIRKSESGDVELNLQVEQFTQWIAKLPKTSKGWVTLKIYPLDKEDPRGFSHNMMQVIRNKTA